MKLLKYPYDDKAYFHFAVEANQNGKVLIILDNNDVQMTEGPPLPPEPAKTIFTKLEIRRACRTLELEAKLDALLASAPEFGKDWQDTTHIDLADPVTVDALAEGMFSAGEIERLKSIL